MSAQVGFSKEQIVTLCDTISEVEAVVNGTADEVKGVLKKMTDDSIFDESKQTEQINDTVAKCQKLFSTVSEILDNAVQKVNTVAEKVNVSLRKREMSMEEQNAAIAATTGKIQQ